MREFILETELWLPRPIDEVFAFFSTAANLETLTPPWVGFEVLTPEPIEIQQGTIIDYRIRVHGIPLRWRTEIAEWSPPHRFVDMQVRGPYRFWHHTHTFESQGGGTVSRDRVRYHPVGGVLANVLFVRRDIQRIFCYRRQRMLELFPAV